MLILIADDEAGIRNSLGQLLREHHEVVFCEDGQSALQTLEKLSVDLVITDHAMPKLTGIELIKKGKEISPHTAFVLMTAYGSVEQAVEAIKLGADDYFMKPFDLSEIELRVKRIEDLRCWKAENALKHGGTKGIARLVGKSKNIQNAKVFIESVSNARSPVLLLGPSGSGKEVLAKAIHESGERTTRPFVAINCASLSEQLMDSELFGHEKGAFTGANSSKPGKFELAKGGTLFLDEMGELSQGLQAKLLRVLQEKEFFRVGGIRQIKSDARVIAATHRDLKEMVKAGTFREDLYFRLNVLSFQMEPLSRRPEDLEDLIEYFWSKLSSEFGTAVHLDPGARAKLLRYSFPGNVRELQNVLERLVVLGAQAGVASESLLPSEFNGKSVRLESLSETNDIPVYGLEQSVEDLEKKLIHQAMQQSGDNQVKAAILLKITRGTLQYKLKKYFTNQEAA